MKSYAIAPHTSSERHAPTPSRSCESRGDTRSRENRERLGGKSTACHPFLSCSRRSCRYGSVMLFETPHEELTDEEGVAVLRQSMASAGRLPRHAEVWLAGICAEHLVDGLRAAGLIVARPLRWTLHHDRKGGSAMKLPLTGGCVCGSVRYEVTAEPISVYACHCTDCQRITSSAFSIGVVVPDEAFRLTGNDPRSAPGGVTAAGRVKSRLVCSDCGTWMFGTESWHGVSRHDPHRPRWHVRRYDLAEADSALLDKKQAAVGRADRRRDAV